MSRLEDLSVVGRQLSAATSVDQVWAIALMAAMQWHGADAGAWIWSAPMVRSDIDQNSVLLDPMAWGEALAQAGSPTKPKSIDLSSSEVALQGALFLPVRVSGWEGWLGLGRGTGAFQDDDLLSAAWIAKMAELAVSGLLRQQHIEKIRVRQVRELRALHRVTREITSTIDLDYILRVVMTEAIAFTQADAGLIVLFSGDGAQLRVSDGYSAADLAGIEALVGSDGDTPQLSDWFTREETVYVPDLVTPPDAPVLPNARAILVTPVFYEQRLAAAILIQSAKPQAFGSAAIAFAEGLSSQTAIAVGNARRYQEQLERGELMRRRAEQVSHLLEVSRTMRSDRPLDDILLDVAYAVQEGTGFDLVLISVLEGGFLRRVAGAGIPLAELEKRKKTHLRWDRVRRLCREQFRLGQCYYIPEQYHELTEALDVFAPERLDVGEGSGLWHSGDVFFVPLRGSAGDIMGMMSVDRPRDGLAPTATTSEVIEVFASQVAQIIENHHLVESLRKQVTTLQLFNELNRSITTKLDLPLVLNTVVQSVTNLLDYDFSTIYLRDQSDQVFVPMASSGYALDYLADPPVGGEDSFIQSIVRTGMPLVVEDATDDPRFASMRVPVGSSVAVPLLVEGRSVGILTADRKQRGALSPADVATLTALADQVSVAVENARLFEEVKRFNEELEVRVVERTQELAEALERLRLQRDRSEVLYHIASELVASLDMDRVLAQALMLLQRAVRASRSSVILLDNDTGQLFYRAAIGHTRPIKPGGRLAPFDRNTGIVGWVLEKRASLVIPDTLQEDRFSLGEIEPARSAMVAPILGGSGESLGVILFQSPIVNAFDETQLQLVEAAAVQLGNALNNAELYRLIREQAERLGTMLRSQQIDAAKNKAILEGIADGVMVADSDGSVILFNAAAERILSITRQQALGRHQDEIIGLYGSEVHEWLAQISDWKANPDKYGTGAFLAHRLAVGRRFVSIHLSPVLSEAGEFLGVVSVFRDITSEIEADRAKSDFVSTVSHELRTPMTSIVGYVDLLLDGAAGAVAEMQLEFLKRVRTNADRLTNLVNDLLDISRIEQGRIELLRRPMSVEMIIAQVVDSVDPKIKERSQTLGVVLPSDLPQVFGDSDRLTQILVNLVSNAYKYTPVGGHVTIHAYVREGMMYVAVADTGIGIAPENQKKIFERFYRVEDDPAVYEVSGTGLGLAITLSLIQMHGGSIWLESELGRGSIFTFSVPLAQGESAEDRGALPPSVVTPPAPTILVVEDDTEISQLLKVTLESEGMKTLTAYSGEQALQLAREQLPDFISLDIRLPDLDGLQVLQLLKRDPETADIPVVIVTVVSDRERGRALGALDYLTKPMDAQKLLGVIKRTLRQRDVVVVADSDREALNRLRSALQMKGIAVRTTMRGERALRMARDLHPVMLVFDLGISDLDGYQLLDRLRRDRQTSEIPVVVTIGPGVTARSEAEKLQEKLRGLGGIRFLFKPFSPEELMVNIPAMVNGTGVDKEP